MINKLLQHTFNRNFFYLVIFSLIILTSVFFVNQVKAEVSKQELFLAENIEKPKLEISLPGLNLTDPEVECLDEACKKKSYTFSWIGQYIVAFYRWSIILLIVLSLVIITQSGFMWLMAGGLPDKIKEAKTSIVQAILGLVLGILASQIMAIINPALNIFKPITLSGIPRVEWNERIGSPGSGSVGRGKVNEANSKSCPSSTVGTSFEAVVTAYFEPTEEDFKQKKTRTYGYTSFECLVAIECGCKGLINYIKKDDPNWVICASISGKDYGPCEPITTLEQFKTCCSGIGASGKMLKPYYSLATDPKTEKMKNGCFPFGTKISISGSSVNDLNRVWEVMDTGGAVKGTHLDLFVSDPALVGSLTEKVTAIIVQ